MAVAVECCVLTLPLLTEPWQEHILEKRFKLVEHLQNSLIAYEFRKLKNRLDGNLLEISLKPKSMDEVQGQFMGLIRFTPDSWGRVEDTLREPLPKTVEKLDMTTLLQGMIQKGFPVQAIPTDKLWLESDTQDDIQVYEKNFTLSL